MNGFDQQKAKGKVVEEIVKQHLISRGHTVIDVSETADYQKYDVDLLIPTGNEEYITIEVKRDDNISKTGNFFYEIGFEKEAYYSMGWVDKCRADYICFYDTNTSKGYILDFDKSKAFIAENGKKITFWDKIDQCEGLAYVIPTYKVRKAGLIVYTWEEEQ